MPDPHFANTPAYFKEVSNGITPSSGQVALYAKTDGLLYSKDDTGTEKSLVFDAASPGPIGGTTPASGTFTSITAPAASLTNITTPSTLTVPFWFKIDSLLQTLTNGIIGTNGIQMALASQVQLGWTSTSNDPLAAADVVMSRVSAGVMGLRGQASTSGGCAIQLQQVASGGTPSANTARLYSKDVGGTAKMFTMNEDGTETLLGFGTLKQGSSNIWIPAAQLIPKTTSGCGVNSRETTTYDQNFDTCVFDSVASEYADFTVVMPDNYDLGTVVAKFHWTAFTASAGTVTWGIKGVSMTNDDPLDIDAGTPQTVSDTYILSGDEHVTDYTSAVTIAGTPQANERVQFTVYRDIIDTLGADAELIGIEIVYNGGGGGGSGVGGTMFRADASEFIPTTTAGCGVDSQETTTFKINRDYLTFSSTTDNSAMFWFNWPSGWNTAKASFIWNAPTGTGSVVWSAAMRVFTDGESTDLALGTAQNVTDAAASANTVRQSAGTSGITPAGTIGAGKRTVLRISRLASSDGADDMAAIAYLEGVLIEKAS